VTERDLTDVRRMAYRIRRTILDAAHQCDTSAHIGGALSMADITAVLYGAVMRFDPQNPTSADRDRFILSKGHGALGYYAALAAVGAIPPEVMRTYQTNGSDLTAHPVVKPELGIESSNGSLGQGLSFAIGLALAARRQGRDHRIFTLLGDGECNEGAVWEAAMCAAHYGLENLTVIVDRNGFQNDGDSREILDLQDMPGRWRAFGWDVVDLDGHDVDALYDAFTAAPVQDQPRAVIARTIKGRGIEFMEDSNDWHHNRLTKKHYEAALEALEPV